MTPGAAVLYEEGSLEPGQHVSLMGADGPGKAEVAIEELRRAHLFCDDWEQASHGGELAAAVSAGVVGRDDVTELGAVLVGDAEGRRSAGDITLFDSTGLAIQDLAIAKVAYAKRAELNLQTIDVSRASSSFFVSIGQGLQAHRMPSGSCVSLSRPERSLQSSR